MPTPVLRAVRCPGCTHLLRADFFKIYFLVTRHPGVVPGQRLQGYIDNLMVLREAGLGAGIGFWNFFNAMPYGGISQYDITEAELRWQVYTSLAIGSKGVLYFCYVRAAPPWRWSPTLPPPTRVRARCPTLSAIPPVDYCDMRDLSSQNDLCSSCQ